MRLLFALQFVLAFSVLRAQEDASQDLTRVLIEHLVAAEDHPAKLKNTFERYQPGESCDSMQIATFFWLVIAQRDPDWAEPYPLTDSLCPFENNLLHYALGVFAFSKGDLNAMKTSAQAALATASSPYRTYMAWNLLATYYQQVHQLDSAYNAFVSGYLAGKDVLKDHPDPVGFNNLANAALMTEQWEHAVHWAQLAEETYYDALKNGADKFIWGEDFHDQILSNRLMAEMNMLDSTAAAATHDRMRLHLGTSTNSIMIGATATAYLLWSGRRSDFEDLQEVLEASFASDSVLSTEVLGIHVMLFEPWKSQWQAYSNMPDSAIWAYVSTCPVDYRDAALPRLGDVTVNASGQPSGWQPWIQMGAIGIWGAALAFGLMRWRRSRKLDALDTSELISMVNKGFAEGVERPTRHAFHALLKRHPAHRKHHEPTAVEHLTDREREVLNDWMTHMRPKETAEKLGISAAAVYNLRSQIRRKLRVPEGEDVPLWLKQSGTSNH